MHVVLGLVMVKGKCSVEYSAIIPRKCASDRQKRVEVCVAIVVHPCRVKSFREAVASTVMDVLGEVLANKD